MSPRALACPASLKGCLSAIAAAAALKRGFAAAGVEADALPIADGGEGTVDVLCSEFEEVETVDAFGRPRVARAGVLGDARVIEAAEAIPLDPSRLDVWLRAPAGSGCGSRSTRTPRWSWPSVARRRWTPGRGCSR